MLPRKAMKYYYRLAGKYTITFGTIWTIISAVHFELWCIHPPSAKGFYVETLIYFRKSLRLRAVFVRIMVGKRTKNFSRVYRAIHKSINENTSVDNAWGTESSKMLKVNSSGQKIIESNNPYDRLYHTTIRQYNTCNSRSHYRKCNIPAWIIFLIHSFYRESIYLVDFQKECSMFLMWTMKSFVLATHWPNPIQWSKCAGRFQVVAGHSYPPRLFFLSRL